MSVQLIGKQKVGAKIIPVDKDGKEIDLGLFPNAVQPGTILVSSSDQNIATVEKDPSNELSLVITSTGDLAGTVNIDFIGRNSLGDTIVGQDQVIVTLPETTTSTSTSSTTTEAPAEEPIAVGFNLSFGTPEDVV